MGSQNGILTGLTVLKSNLISLKVFLRQSCSGSPVFSN